MRDILGLGLVTIYAGAYCLTAIAWLGGMALLFRTMANRKAGVSLWGAELGYLPLALLFRPDLLTERGLDCRAKFGKALLVFIAALATGLCLGYAMRFLS
jgi:hypothetical protein